MDSWIPYLVGYNYVSSWSSDPGYSQWESLQIGSCVLSTYPYIFQALFFLPLYNTPGSSCTFPVLAVASAASPTHPG